MSHHKTAWLALISLLIAVTACDPLSQVNAPRCELLEGPNNALRELDWDAVNRSNLNNWITETFNVADSALDRDVTADDPNHRRVRWTIDGSRYQTHTFDDSLEAVTVQFTSSVPRAQELIDCFGSPGHYRATYFNTVMRNTLYVEFWYPNEGMIAQLIVPAASGEDEPPAIDGRSALAEISYSRWTEAERMVWLAPIPLRNTLDAYPLKPWPGSFEAIEVEIDPRLQD